MGFKFSAKDTSATRAVLRIAAELLATSHAEIATPRLPRDQLVHELRKSVKKTRALLRLVRPGMKGFAAENAALRDAARLIAPLRDADVLAASFDKVAGDLALPSYTTDALRARLPGRTGATIDAEALLAAHDKAIAVIAARAKGWKVEGKGFDALAPGLERSWTAAQKAMKSALKAPDAAALHLWRKRVKDHWYHARLLAPVWPEMMAHHITAADILGETLGDARDLAALAEALNDIPEARSLREEALRQEERLLTDAQALGTRFLSEPATGLSRRWRGWWEIWTKA